MSRGGCPGDNGDREHLAGNDVADAVIPDTHPEPGPPPGEREPPVVVDCSPATRAADAVTNLRSELAQGPRCGMA